MPANTLRVTRDHHRRSLATLAAVCTIASVSACTSTTDGQAHLASGAVTKKVTSDAFTTLLLTPNEVAAAVGTPTLTLDGDLTDPAQAQSLSDAHCSGAAWLMLGDVYHGTGYLQVHWGRWSAPQPTYVMAFQGVALYPTSLKANDFLAHSKKTWSECAGKSVSRQFKDGNDVFTLGTPTTDNSTVTVVNLFEGGGGSGCSHSLTAKANVVVETMVCTDTNLSAQRSQSLATAIADRINR